MEHEADVRFDADAQIGKGMRFIDRNGRATIGEGNLTLSKQNGDLIASAPIGEIWADKARWSGGGAARVWIGDESYSVQPLHIGRITAGFTPAESSAANLGRDVKRIKGARQFTQQFLQALQDAGARMGKPN